MPFPSENFRHNPEQKLKIHQNTTAIPLRHRLIFLSFAGSGVVDQDAVLAPEFTFNMMVRKEWDLPVTGGRLAVQIAGNYIDTHYPSVIKFRDT